jgi:hypothetical protein
VWSNALFLTFLLLLRHWLLRRTFFASILLALVFVATFLHYHTTSLWIIAALIAAVAAMKLRAKRRPDLFSAPSWALPLFCSVFYLAFDTILYSNGLARVSNEATGALFVQTLARRILAPLRFAAPRHIEAFEVVTVNPRTATYTTLCVILLLTIPVSFWCLRKFYRAIRTRKPEALAITTDDIFVWAVLIAAATHTFLYALYGAYSDRVIPLAFPLILPLVVREFDLAGRVERILPALLAALAIVGFLSFWPTLKPDSGDSTVGVAPKLIGMEDKLLGDADTFGSMLTASAGEGKYYRHVWLNSERYSSLVGQRPIEMDEFDFAAVEISDDPIVGIGWTAYEPWTWNLSAINQNRELNKVYDSENLVLFKPSDAELPSYQLNQNDLAAASRPLFKSVTRLFLTVLALIFLPGMFFLISVHTKGVLEIGSHTLFIGFSVGPSIVCLTLAGYIANFVISDLSWLVPLFWVGTVSAPALYLFTKTGALRMNDVVLSQVLVVIAILFVWSVLSVGAIEKQDEFHAEYTEFFVTQPHSRFGELAINVVNTLNQSANFEMTFKINGREVDSTGPQIIAQDSAWTEMWRIPATLADGMLIISLEKDGRPYRELHINDLGHFLGEMEDIGPRPKNRLSGTPSRNFGVWSKTN